MKTGIGRNPEVKAEVLWNVGILFNLINPIGLEVEYVLGFWRIRSEIVEFSRLPDWFGVAATNRNGK